MRLKSLRKQHKLTQHELAEKLGIGRTTYLGYESGKIAVPAIRLQTLATLFNVSMEYITGQSEHKNIYEQMDAMNDTDALRREMIAREFARDNLAKFLQIAIDEIENKRNEGNMNG